MLDLDNIRKEYAAYLSADPKGRWRMDAAMAHVITLAYEKGLKDGSGQVPAPAISTVEKS